MGHSGLGALGSSYTQNCAVKSAVYCVAVAGLHDSPPRVGAPPFVSTRYRSTLGCGTLALLTSVYDAHSMFRFGSRGPVDPGGGGAGVLPVSAKGSDGGRPLPGDGGGGDAGFADRFDTLAAATAPFVCLGVVVVVTVFSVVAGGDGFVSHGRRCVGSGMGGMKWDDSCLGGMNWDGSGMGGRNRDGSNKGGRNRDISGMAGTPGLSGSDGFAPGAAVEVGMMMSTAPRCSGSL